MLAASNEWTRIQGTGTHVQAGARKLFVHSFISRGSWDLHPLFLLLSDFLSQIRRFVIDKYKMYLLQANPYGRTSLATINEHSPAAHSSEARAHYQPYIQRS